MDHNLTIGSRIKSLRTDKKYTLKQLSEETGLSLGFLSQMERGISSIAIDSLAKIAQCLGVSLSSFFEEEQEEILDPVVHFFSRRHSQVSSQIVQSVLSHDMLSYDMLPRIFHLMPFANPKENKLEMYAHSGEEFIYVISGIITLWLDGKPYTMYPGDSIQINSTIPHNWMNPTNKISELLAINYPNPFKADATQHFIP